MTAESAAENPRTPARAFTASDVTFLRRILDAVGIRYWIDGGWGVDALLREQTRAHEDLDIVVRDADVTRFRSSLATHGFREVEQKDARHWNFVLADTHGRKVDVHVVVMDAEGKGVYGPLQNGDIYPASALAGRGVIDG